MKKICLLVFLCIWSIAQDIFLLSPMDEKLVENNPQNYLWSEKLDGIRAYWDGKALYTRSGKKINPPAFFIQNFPPFAIDGELWSKRGDFENIVSIIKNKNRSLDWKNLKFYIFEVPNQKGGLLQRLEVLQTYLQNHYAPFIQIIPHHPISSTQELFAKLDEITQNQGEGIVVRNKNVAYYTGRTKDSMKLKKYQDRECKITQYIQGQGKFKKIVGSFLCQDGTKSIRIGSGMDEKFRNNPPPIGTIITYKFFGYTQHGNPRFPTFLRIRNDIDLQTKEK